MRYLIAGLTLIMLFLLTGSVLAQDVRTDDEVYITTQDYSSLRLLPSKNTERLTIIPPATTLKAYGRSSRTDWIQVEYEGQTGWVASWLLVWTGRVIELPIDGVNPPEFIRRTVVSGETFRETPIYKEGIDPSTQIGTLQAGEFFEVTGYVGVGERYWVQINHHGLLSWVGSWDVHVLDGNITNTLNGAYRYVYGRANINLERDVTNGVTSLVAIDLVWKRLQNGENVECSPIPPYAIRATIDGDIQREPIFTPVAIALDDGIVDVNAMISKFEDICTSDSPVVTLDDITLAIDTIERARRNMILAQALLNELDNRDPLVN